MDNIHMVNLVLAAAYLRASSKKQDTSVPEQRRQLNKFAKRHGFRIVAWYVDDGKSGSRDVEKRTDFTRLLADAPNAEWKVILCLDISRFGRLDTIEGAFAKQILRNAGVRLHTILEGEIDWNSTTGRIVDAVLTEAQHDYSFRLGQKALQGKLRAFLEGEPFGFKTPYAYARKVTDPQGNERLVPRTEKFTKPKGWKGTLFPGDQDEIQILEWLFTTFATRDVGFRWLAAELNERKVPSPTGQRWCGKVVQEILMNRKYIGTTTLGEREAGAFWRLDGDEVVEATTKATIRKEEPLVAENTHEPLVDAELFQKVQEKIERRKAQHSHSKGNGGYVLKDVLFCGCCGRPLYGNPNGRGNPNSKKSGRTMYVCKTAIRYGKQCECGQWSVKEDEVLPFLKQTLLAELDRNVLEESRAKPPKSIATGLDKKVAELSRKIEQGTENFLAAPKELTAECASKLSEWKAERGRLQSEIEAQSEEAEDWPRRCQRHLESLRGGLIRLQTASSANGKYGTGVALRNDTFRELLVSNGCRLDFWWERGSANRWKVCKVRLRLFGNKSFETPGLSALSNGAGNTAPFESIASLMV